MQSPARGTKRALLTPLPGQFQGIGREHLVATIVGFSHLLIAILWQFVATFCSFLATFTASFAAFWQLSQLVFSVFAAFLTAFEAIL